MSKHKTLKAGRAVASTMVSRYAGKLLYFVTLFFGVLSIIIILLSLLTSGWWGLLLIVTVPLGVLSLLLYLLIKYIASRIAPHKLLKIETRKTNELIDAFQKNYVGAQALRKSPKLLGISAVYAYITGGKNKAVSTVMGPIENAKDLKSQFNELVKLFDKR